MPGSTNPLIRSIELYAAGLILNNSPGLILISFPTTSTCNIPLLFVNVLGIISVLFAIKVLFLVCSFSSRIELSTLYVSSGIQYKVPEKSLPGPFRFFVANFFYRLYVTVPPVSVLYKLLASVAIVSPFCIVVLCWTSI